MMGVATGHYQAFLAVRGARTLALRLRRAEQSARILSERLEAPLAPLDQLPRGLWLGALTSSVGALVPRLEELERLRAGLHASEPGDLLWERGTVRYAPRYPVEIVDRIGAGDS